MVAPQYSSESHASASTNSSKNKIEFGFLHAGLVVQMGLEVQENAHKAMEAEGVKLLLERFDVPFTKATCLCHFSNYFKLLT